MKKITTGVGIVAFAAALFFNTTTTNGKLITKEFKLSNLITNASAQSENRYFKSDGNGGFIEVDASEIETRADYYENADKNTYYDSDSFFDWDIGDYQPTWEQCRSNETYYAEGSGDANLEISPTGGGKGGIAGSGKSKGTINYNNYNQMVCSDGKYEDCITTACI
jgi:hypothetical protein